MIILDWQEFMKKQEMQINKATQIAGIVVSKDGEIVYPAVREQEYNTIAAAIYHQSSGTVEDSFWDCVYMTLIYEGVGDLTYADMKSAYTNPLEALTELGKYPGADISGISLDLVFGYYQWWHTGNQPG